MNRLEKLKEKIANDFMNSIFRLEPWKDPPDYDECFNYGFEAASAEYEKIIAELEGALEWYEKRDRIHGIERASPAIDSLKKLNEFRGWE